MAKEGATVYATDVNLKLLESLTGQPGIVTQKLDVLDDLQIKFTIEGLPPLNILFNCAGFVHQGTIMETHDEDWDFSFNLNVRAPFKVIQAALPRMVANGGGSSSTWQASAAASRACQTALSMAPPRRQ